MSIHVESELGVSASGSFSGEVKVMKFSPRVDPGEPPGSVSGGTLTATALGFTITVTGGGVASNNFWQIVRSLVISGLGSASDSDDTGNVLWLAEPGGTLHTRSIAGTWTISGTAQRCINYQPGASFADDMPHSTDVEVFLRWKPGTNITCTATAGELSASVTVAAPAGSAITLSVGCSSTVSTNCGVDYDGVSNSLGATGTLLGTEATAPVSGSGGGISESCTGGTTASVSGNRGLTNYDASATVTRSPDKKAQVECVIYREKEPCLDAVRVLVDTKAGVTETFSTAGGTLNVTINQEYYSGSTGHFGSVSKNEYALLTMRVDPTWLADNAEGSTNYRIFLHGFLSGGLTLTHPDSFEIDDCAVITPIIGDYPGNWTAGANTALADLGTDIQATVVGGQGSFTRNFVPLYGGMGSYAYFVFEGYSNIGGTFRVRIGNKTWTTNYQGNPLTFPIGVGNKVMIDLCNPDNATPSIDYFDSRWPTPTDDDHPDGDGAYWGCQSPKSVTFDLIADGSVVNIESLKLARLGEGKATFCPDYLKLYEENDGSFRRRFLLGNADGKSSIEETDTYISPAGVHQERTIENLYDDIIAVDAPMGKRNPGWQCTMDASINVADSDTVFYGLMNKNRPATWLFGGGLIYIAGEGWVHGFDIDYTLGKGVYSQLLFDRLQWYGGCGDIFSFSSTPPADNTVILVKAHKIFRGRAWGIVFDYDTHLRKNGVTVSVSDDSGTGSTSNGVYITGYPYAKPAYHDVFVPGSLGNLYFWTRKSHRVCFRSSEVGGQAVSYDVSYSMRHARAYIENGTIRMQTNKEVYLSQWNTPVNTGVTADAVEIRYDRGQENQPIWVFYQEAGANNLKNAYTYDEGRNTTLVQIITTSGTRPTMVITRDGRRCYFWLDGSAIKGVVHDAQGNILVPQFTAVASGVDDDDLACDEFLSSLGEWLVALLYRSGTNIRVVTARGDFVFS